MHTQDLFTSHEKCSGETQQHHDNPDGPHSRLLHRAVVTAYGHVLPHPGQVTAVAFCDSTQQIVSGGLDNAIKVWDLRQNQLAYVLHGHSDTVTGLDVSADGCYLASNSMDRTGGWGRTCGWGRMDGRGRTGGWGRMG